MNLKTNFTNSHFQQYLDSLKASGTSQSSIDRKLSSLNSFQNFLIKKNYLNPIPNPSLDKVETSSDLNQNNNLFKNIFRTPLSRKVARKAEGFEPKKNFLTRYLIFGTLIAIILGLGYGLYSQTISKAKTELAYSTATAPVRAGRVLSFQGRLTDSAGNPISASTAIVFKFFNSSVGGTELYNSNIGNSQVVVPDENGIFSVVIGKSHGTEIPSSVFSENAEVWLEITAGGEIMSPRQQIATVAYALNSETLQGLPPSASGLKDTVLVIDDQGNLNLGETSPTIKSTSGTFGIEGQAVLLKASDGSGGNITINPDGNGTIHFLTEGTSPSSGGFIDLSNANIAGGNLINSQINNDNRGYNFLSLQNYDTGTTALSTRFSIGASGNVYISNNLSMGSTTLATNLNADLIDGYHVSNLGWIANVGTSNISINTGTSLTFAAGTGLSASLIGNTLTFSNIGVGTTYTAGVGLTLSSTNVFSLNLGSTNVWTVLQTFGAGIGVTGNLTIGGTFTGVGSTNVVSLLDAQYLNTHSDSYFVNVGQTGSLPYVNAAGVGLSLSGTGPYTLGLNLGATNVWLAPEYFGNSIGVTGNSTFQNNLSVGGTLSGTYLYLTAGLGVTGNSVFTNSVGIGDSLGITNSLTVGGTISGTYLYLTAGLGVTGNSVFTNSVGIGGSLSVGTTLTAASINSTGNLTVGGTFTGVGSTNLVTNLNAQYLNGHPNTDFLNTLSSGTGISITGSGIGRTIAIDGTSIGNMTFGSGSTFTWTFNSGATNPTINFANGNIGIGTSSAPRTALEVNGTVAAQKFVDLTSYDQFFMDLANSDYNSSSISLDRRGSIKWNSTFDTGTSGWETIDNGVASMIQNQLGLGGDPGGLLLATSQTGVTNAGSAITSWNQNLFLSNNGDVGIGMTNPQSALQINGDLKLSGTNRTIYFDTTANINANSINVWQSDSSGNQIFRPSVGLGNFYWQNNAGSTTNMTLSGSGYLGLGTTNPTGPFQVSIGNTQALFVASGGNVGIGTSNPQARLDIAAANSTIANSSGDITISAASGNISLNSNRIIDIAQVAAGSGLASAPAYSFSSDATSGLYSNGIGTLSLATAGTPNLTINSSGYVGIGTTNPGYKLEVAGDAALISNTTGVSLTIGGKSGTAWPYTIDTKTGAFLRILSGNAGASPFTIDSNGLVGIGMTSPAYALDVTAVGTTAVARFKGSGSYSTCTFNSNGTLTCSSDARLKTNVNNTNYGLSTLSQLRPVDFNWITDPNNPTKNLGFIAQEVQQLIPGLVITDSDGYEELNSIGLIPVIVKSIQEQQAIIAANSSALNNVFVSSNGQIGVNFNVSDSVLASLGYSDTKNEIENATYSLTDSTGKLITTIGQFAQVTAAKFTAGLVSATNIIADNLSAKRVTSETVLTGDLSATTIESNSATISGTLTAQSIGASTASFSTVYADQIINPEGNISDVMANKINDLRTEIKAMIASSSAVATPSAIMADATTWDTSVATQSADLTLDNLTLNNNMVIGAMLTVNGQTKLNSAAISNTLTVGQIALNDNILETTSDNLYIQPSGLGTVHILNDRLVLASDGSVTINGNLNINGSLVANLLKVDDIQTKTLTAEKINIATVSAIIASALPAEVSTQAGTLTSNATVGTITIAAGQTEVSVTNSQLTASSMVYLTPNGSTQNQVPYLKNKSGDTFTVAIDQPLDHDVNINWWLIN
jgi:hypothetical protein